MACVLFGMQDGSERQAEVAIEHGDARADLVARAAVDLFGDDVDQRLSVAAIHINFGR